MKVSKALQGVDNEWRNGAVVLQVDGKDLPESDITETSNQIVANVQVSPGDIISIVFYIQSGAVDIADLLVDGILRNSKINTRASRAFSDIFDRACYNPRKPGKLARAGMKFCEMRVLDWSGNTAALATTSSEPSPIGTIEVRYYRIDRQSSATAGPSNQDTEKQPSTLSRGPNFVNYATWSELEGSVINNGSPPPFEIDFCNPSPGDTGLGPKKRVVKEYPATYKLWCSFVFRLRPKSGDSNAGTFLSPDNPENKVVQEVWHDSLAPPGSSSTISTSPVSSGEQTSLSTPVVSQEIYQDSPENLGTISRITNSLDASRNTVPAVPSSAKAQTQEVRTSASAAEITEDTVRKIETASPDTSVSLELSKIKRLPVAEEVISSMTNGHQKANDTISATLSDAEIHNHTPGRITKELREGLGITVENVLQGNALNDGFDKDQHNIEISGQELVRSTEVDDGSNFDELSADKRPSPCPPVEAEVGILKAESIESSELQPTQRDIAESAAGSSFAEHKFKRPSQPLKLAGIPGAPVFHAWQDRGSTREPSAPLAIREPSVSSEVRDRESIQEIGLSPILGGISHFDLQQQLSTPRPFSTSPCTTQKPHLSREYSILENKTNASQDSFDSTSGFKTAMVTSSLILGSSPAITSKQKRTTPFYSPRPDSVPLNTGISSVAPISGSKDLENEQRTSSATAQKVIADSQAITARCSSNEPVVEKQSSAQTCNGSTLAKGTGAAKRKVHEISTSEPLEVKKAFQLKQESPNTTLDDTKRRKGKEREQLAREHYGQQLPLFADTAAAKSPRVHERESDELYSFVKLAETTTAIAWEAEERKASNRYSIAIQSRNIAREQYENALLENKSRAQIHELMRKAAELENETAELRKKTRALREEFI
ncbi:hypothetical protein BP6252_10473 [Coleophoma cylindrospora]|uniref:Uncharacterized protein n=1 Tax=Coleophoma cylindrospora TaxID=1849047 RepID=A0A3D8QSR4_9HELO|nr:hypothetical protein BP6252_10473 [Coleophoma cylindrospora]